MNFEANIKTTEDTITVFFKGVLDHRAELPRLIIHSSQTVIFDFDEIVGINSYGIRSWVNFVESLPSAGPKYIFRNCRPQIVDQITMLQGFKRQDMAVESFYVSYFGECCGGESTKNVLVDALTMKTSGLPEVNCDKCGSTLFPEEEEEIYEDLVA